MKILLDYTLHNREVIEVDDEVWESLSYDPEIRKDVILDTHILDIPMGHPIVRWEFSTLDCEVFEPLSD